MSIVRTIVTAGLTSVALGALARGWSWMRYGPARMLPPLDCAPRGARVAGLEVARREQGLSRTASVVVLVHDRGEDGERVLGLCAGLGGQLPLVMLAPTAPMPADEGGAAWLWAEPWDPGFADALRSAARGLGAYLREARRCHPGRRLVALGVGQGAQVLLAAAADDPTVADALVAVTPRLPAQLVPAALPRTICVCATSSLESRALAERLAARGLPVITRLSPDAGELALALAELAALLERNTSDDR